MHRSNGASMHYYIGKQGAFRFLLGVRGLWSHYYSNKRQEQYYLFSGNLEIFDYGGVGPPSSRPNPPVMIRFLVRYFSFCFCFCNFFMHHFLLIALSNKHQQWRHCYSYVLSVCHGKITRIDLDWTG